MDSSADQYRVEVARNADDLTRYRDAWDKLVRHAADPNVFYEPFSLLAAIDAFGAGKDSRFVFVVRDTDSGNIEAVALFPMELKTRFRGVPFKHFAAWQHPQLFLATPLVRRDCGTLAWLTLLRWARLQSAQFSLIELPLTLREGETMRSLHRVLKSDGDSAAIVDSFERSLLTRKATSAEEYGSRFGSAGAYREWRRQRRRLSERGKLEVRRLEPIEDVEPWLDRFMAMEARGWKGKIRSALVSDPNEARYFRTICRSAHATGRLHMLGLFLDDAPIAMQCNILARGGAFALKVAYDENFSKYSPGALLELENIDDMFRREDFVWMDSCTRSKHPLMHRIWHDRITIEHILVAPGGLSGRLVVALYPYLQRARREFSRIRSSIVFKRSARLDDAS
jgi:CelD/BcsL family acetyltransferase involved in cellulose biosynthesis